MKNFIMGIMLVALVGCESDHFTVKGEIADAGTQNMRLLYVTDDERVATEWVTLSDGKFEATGSNYDWTIVYLIDGKRVLGRAAVKNGDEVTLEGSIAEPYSIMASGTEANEEWSAFIGENAQLYRDQDWQELNKAIERYVRGNLNKVSSTLLLLNDYTNMQGSTPVDTLFKAIEIDARPSGLVNNYYALANQRENENSKSTVLSMTMYSSEDSMMTFSPGKFKASLLYFWSQEDAGRKEIVEKLKELHSKHEEGGRLQMVDVLLSSDSLNWKKKLAQDSTEWRHYWAVGGEMNKSLTSLNIGNSPYFIVTNTVGRQLYRGGSVEEAINAADKQMELR